MAHGPGMYYADTHGTEKGYPCVTVREYNCSGPAWSHYHDDITKRVQAIEIMEIE